METPQAQSQQPAQLLQPQQQCYSPEDLRALAATDLNFWAGLLIPDIAIYQFPQHYQDLWILCIKSFLQLQAQPTNDEQADAEREKLFKLALALPRGFVKTTFMKLLVAYGLVHRLFDFPLIVCSNDGNAENFVSDVHNMLSAPVIVSLYDSWARKLTEDNKSQKRTTFMGRHCILKASGVSGGIRGVVIDNKRPDAILCDDAQTSKDAESTLETDKLRRTLVGTVFKTKNPHRCGIIYIGNRYIQNCILDDLVASGEFISLVTGAILADGESLWPQLHSVPALMREYRMDAALGQAHIWFAEVMNQPTQRPNALLPDGDFPLTSLAFDVVPVGAFVTIDPAGSKPTSDDTTIAGHVLYDDGTCEVARLVVDKLTPKDTIYQAATIAEEIGAKFIFPEAIAYQSTLAYWFNELQDGAKVALEAIPLHTGGASKLKRIRAWVQELLQGDYVICDTAIKATVLFQLLAFRVESTKNRDDVVDVCAMGTLVRAQHSAAIISVYKGLKVQPVGEQTVVGSLLSAIPRRFRSATRFVQGAL